MSQRVDYNSQHLPVKNSVKCFSESRLSTLIKQHTTVLVCPVIFPPASAKQAVSQICALCCITTFSLLIEAGLSVNMTDCLARVKQNKCEVRNGGGWFASILWLN